MICPGPHGSRSALAVLDQTRERTSSDRRALECAGGASVCSALRSLKLVLTTGHANTRDAKSAITSDHQLKCEAPSSIMRT
jgi:hypothetical protein